MLEMSGYVILQCRKRQSLKRRSASHIAQSAPQRPRRSYHMRRIGMVDDSAPMAKRTINMMLCTCAGAQDRPAERALVAHNRLASDAQETMPSELMCAQRHKRRELRIGRRNAGSDALFTHHGDRNRRGLAQKRARTRRTSYPKKAWCIALSMDNFPNNKRGARKSSGISSSSPSAATSATNMAAKRFWRARQARRPPPRPRRRSA